MRLSEFMAANAVSDEDLAAKAGCSRVTISRIRRGVAEPSLRLAARIKEITKGAVTPNDFLTEPAPSLAEAS